VVRYIDQTLAVWIKRKFKRFVITHPHFRRADQGDSADFRGPLPGSAISESMNIWIALICSA
jgi:hypothetical protein